MENVLQPMELSKFPSAISHTLRDVFSRCPTYAKFKYIKKLQPKEKTVDLVAGAAFSEGIKISRRKFFQESAEESFAISCGVEALEKSYGDFQPPLKSTKTKNRMVGALLYYFKKFPLEILTPITYNKKLVIDARFYFDLPFKHPDTNEILQFVVKPDFLGVADKKLYLIEEKTTGYLSELWFNQWKMDPQISAYLYWIKYKTNLLSTGEFNSIEAQIRGIGIEKDKFSPTSIVILREDWQLEQWYEQTLRMIEDMLKAYKTGDWQIRERACFDYGRPCDFLNLCLSKNPKDLIEGNYEILHWSPLPENTGTA